jgi:hypothetical protein
MMIDSPSYDIDGGDDEVIVADESNSDSIMNYINSIM